MTGRAFRPADDNELTDLVAWAAGDRIPLEVIGAGTKRRFGHAVAADHILDMSRCSGVVDYEPAELVLTVEAGTAVAEVEALLRASNQQLAFEPPDLGPLLDAPAASATMGGIMAGNLSGPRRVSTGAARDHALGAQAVTGRAEAIRVGGRVVKNVTGFDLTKLLCGSWGTLAVLTRLSFKVLPAAEKTRTILVAGVSAHESCRVMGVALSSPHDVTAAAHLPPEIASRSAVGYVSSAGTAMTAIRIEGPPASVLARNDQLKSQLSSCGEVEELHGFNSEFFWKEVRDVATFVDPDCAVLRMSVPPASGGIALAEAEALGAGGYLDWGGGLVWCAFPASAATAIAVRAIAGGLGGHATLVRAPGELKAGVPVFHPQPASRQAITRRIREGFDPSGILNPGRMMQDP